jgi:hypothetical protein
MAAGARRHLAGRRGMNSAAGAAGRGGTKACIVLSGTGVWRECRLVGRDSVHGAIRVHYVGFDAQWDEWLLPEECALRLRWKEGGDEFRRQLMSAPLVSSTSAALDALVAQRLSRQEDGRRRSGSGSGSGSPLPLAAADGEGGGGGDDGDDITTVVMGGGDGALGSAELAQGDGSHGDDDEHATDWQRGSLFEHLFAPYGTTPQPRELPEGWLELVSPFVAWIGSPCLRHCVHGASIGGAARGRRSGR